MTAIHTSRAPDPIGPYSQGFVAGGFIFTSMQLPIDPENPDRPHQDIQGQAQQVINNVKRIVRAGAGSLYTIAKTTLYVTDMDDFAVINKVYEEIFGHHKPARSVVNVPSLPKGYRVAMEAIATVEINEEGENYV